MNLFGRRATCDERSATGSALALGVYAGWASAGNNCAADQAEEDQEESAESAEARPVGPDPAATAANGAWSSGDGGNALGSNADFSSGA